MRYRYLNSIIHGDKWWGGGSLIYLLTQAVNSINHTVNMKFDQPHPNALVSHYRNKVCTPLPKIQNYKQQKWLLHLINYIQKFGVNLMSANFSLSC